MKLPVACLLAAYLNTTALGDVIFNNFGPNDSYDARACHALFAKITLSMSMASASQ